MNTPELRWRELYSEPTPRERQILSYHELYEKSSPAYEELKRKYPQ